MGAGSEAQILNHAPQCALFDGDALKQLSKGDQSAHWTVIPLEPGSEATQTSRLGEWSAGRRAVRQSGVLSACCAIPIR